MSASPFHDFKPTPAQLAKIFSIQAGNPSMLPITWGYMSNGILSLEIRWSNEPKEFYKQSIDAAGEYYGNGIGPVYDN